MLCSRYQYVKDSQTIVKHQRFSKQPLKCFFFLCFYFPLSLSLSLFLYSLVRMSECLFVLRHHSTFFYLSPSFLFFTTQRGFLVCFPFPQFSTSLFICHVSYVLFLLCACVHMYLNMFMHGHYKLKLN